MQVRLHGSDVQFRCEPGQTLLAAGLAAGLDLPYECASGSCGSCRARLLEGQVRWRWAAAPGLSERDRSKGDRILCCQAEPESDCVMQLRTGPGPLPAAPRPRQATVSRLRPLNEDVLELQLRLTDGLPMDYRPGQFVLLQAPPTIGWRAYSMANLPAADGTLQFLVKRKRGGAASGWLFGALRPGDEVALEGPYGRAWLRDEPADRPLWLLAGGSGLAPVWAIAQAALAAAPQHPVRLYFGVQRARDAFWLDEMRRVASAAPALQIVLALAEPSAADPPDCRHGPVAEVLAADLPPQGLQSLYMAGPPGLIAHATERLVRSGRVSADRVYYDRYV